MPRPRPCASAGSALAASANATKSDVMNRTMVSIPHGICRHLPRLQTASHGPRANLPVGIVEPTAGAVPTKRVVVLLAQHHGLLGLRACARPGAGQIRAFAALPACAPSYPAARVP